MDSRSALDRIRVDHANIDLILMDINMPVLSGWGLIESMREADIHTPVLMVSSSNHPSDLSRVDASELIQAFIPKPLTIEKMETYLSDS
ncbi:MAG: response regulator [Flavobacteriales bacterium]